MLDCKHPKGLRFLPCSTADRLPGKWVCDECGFTTNHNPGTGITYLEHPDPDRNWKGKIILDYAGKKSTDDA